MPFVNDAYSFEISECAIVNAGVGDMLRSPNRKVVAIPDLEWWVECFPAGYDDELYGHVGFLLNFSKPISVNFTASIVGTHFNHEEDVDIDVDTMPPATFSIDMLDFIKAENLRDIDAVRYGIIEFKFTIEVMAPITDPFPEMTVAEQLLKTGSTVTLSVDGNNVEISKALLMHTSSVFNAMFTHNTKEAETDCVEVIDFDFITVQAFADYYKGRLPAEIPTELLIELLWFADKYDIRRLSNHMEAYFSDNITTENIFKVATFAATTARHCLVKACLRCYHRESFQNLIAPPEDANIEKYLRSEWRLLSLLRPF